MPAIDTTPTMPTKTLVPRSFIFTAPLDLVCVACTPVLVVEVEDEVPLSRIACALNAAKLLAPDSTAFTENTMPCPQCPDCLQYTQIGAV